MVGPDKINGRIFRQYENQLSNTLCKISQQSLSTSSLPNIWKISEIVPVPKKANPPCHDDYRPVTPTLIIMKSLEYTGKNILIKQTHYCIDDLLFAYIIKNRCVEDVTLSVIDYILSHVDGERRSNKNCAKILYVDISRAFNTIQPLALTQKLILMKVNANNILWEHVFSTKTLQYVKLMKIHYTDYFYTLVTQLIIRLRIYTAD